MWPKIKNFTIDLIQQLDIKKLCIIFFDSYPDAVRIDVVNQHIT